METSATYYREATTVEVPARHIVIILPATNAGPVKMTKKGKHFQELAAIGGWSTEPTNEPKIRVSASAILVDPKEYATKTPANAEAVMI